MQPPPIEYLDRDGSRLAYQVVGSGPHNVIWHLEIIGHLDLFWTDPHIHHLYERMSANSRMAIMQQRGFGMSDPIDYLPTVEQQAEDVLAVMDAAGMPRATLAGMWAMCAPLVLIAVTQPARVSGLLFTNPVLQGSRTKGELLGWNQQEADEYFARYMSTAPNWGKGDLLPLWDSALDTEFNRRLWAMLERCAASPDTARAYLESIDGLDVTALLPSIQAPLRVLRSATGVYPESHGRAIAAAVPRGSYAELPVPLPGAALGEAWIPWVDELAEHVTGHPRAPDADRSLCSILFTDLISSTELLGSIGDAAYRDLRARHEIQVRHAVTSNGGDLVNVSGDGTLSLFSGPTKAVRAAFEIRAAAEDLGVQVRAGVHTGEIDRSPADVSGMAVHIAARVSAAAGAGEVLVSSTVRDLMYGSPFSFPSRGRHVLKGLPEEWELFAVDDGTHAPAGGDAPQTTPTDRAALRIARTMPGLGRLGVRLGNANQRRRASTDA